LVDVRTSQDYGARDRVLSCRRDGNAPWAPVEIPSEPEDLLDDELAGDKTDGERMLEEALAMGLPLVTLDE
jgi:hypothetical protein